MLKLQPSRLRHGCLRRGGGERGLPLFLLAVLVLSGVAPLPVAAQERRDVVAKGGTYRRPLGHDPETLDPARITDIYSRSVSQQIFDGLVQFDQTLTITPALAEFWMASRDGLTWTFTLRKGVRFHHGREVTAEDVVYSLTRLLDPRTRSGAADLFSNVMGAREFREGRAKTVAGLAAKDRYTVQIVLNEAVGPFVAVLAVGHAKIVPKDVVEQLGEGFGVQPVGTGPFKFERWERGREIALTANPDYFGGPPHLSRLVYRIFAGERWETTYDEFRQGNLEDAPVPSRDYRRVVASGGHIYVKRPMISVRFYGLNTRLKPLDDRRVRQALLYAINREAIIEEVYSGRYFLARGILPPGTQGFNPRLPGYPYDPQRARQLLADAGYPGGRGLPPLQIWSSGKLEALVRELEQIKQYLGAVGIEAQVSYQTDWPTYSKLLDEGKLPVFAYAWYADVPDPDNFLFKLFHSTSPRNFFRYSSPMVDDVLVAARNAPDIQRRVELYQQAEQLVLDDAPLIPMMHHTYERLFQPYVRSVEVNGLGDPYIPLRKIWLERAR
ncbi:MAG: ABC transporter substrate-binding protein [Candidatus Rokuibacteriota bacterium]|nr:MAG: ABC transporter substrate-binding protein [Candidatus Rokubacteria bacterium]